MPRLVRPTFDKVALGLIAMILVAFVIGAYRVDKQAQALNDVAEAQQRFVFEFSLEQPNQKAVITCVKINAKYVCVTEQPTRATPTPTPIAH